ncbi:MAG: hypothetical protein PW792_15720 [Acidobacteriaceae bacterium]|nr:hypothetical protein [Acidobacteriaceae bacterium]
MGFIPASDFKFPDFLTLCDGTRRPSHMVLANLLVNIGQLAVAVIGLAILIRRK